MKEGKLESFYGKFCDPLKRCEFCKFFSGEIAVDNCQQVMGIVRPDCSCDNFQLREGRLWLAPKLNEKK